MGMIIKKLRKQTLDGNVETIILAILETGPNYGYAIVKELSDRYEGILQLGEGTIYPILYKLEDKKLLSAKWCLSEKKRRRKYYHLTPKGRKALAENQHQWQMLSTVMENILTTTENLLPKPNIEGATI